MKSRTNRMWMAVAIMLSGWALAPRAEAGVSASGGNYTNDIPGYRIHMFTNSATASNFVVAADGGGNVEVLVVAGGGGGGCAYGGGGGGGGVIYSNSFAVASSSNYTVTVGAGGASTNVADANIGGRGGNSVFGPLIAYGGGGGAGYWPNPAHGAAGGCGGGGAFNGSGGAGTNGQGYAGGSSVGASGSYAAGGGGGGAYTNGFPGTHTPSDAGGDGGAGVSSKISGAWMTYGGGGGGGTYKVGPGGAGGAGGGGAGGSGAASNVPGTNGVNGTGGGGGGSGYYNGTAASGAGGSGIVIVRYALQNWPYCMPITFTNDTRLNTLTNFPALVVFDTNKVNYGQFQANGQDLRFLDSNGAELRYEVESWMSTNSASSNSYIWVQIPTLTAGCSITAYWGNASASLPSYRTNGTAWDSTFKAVWHLKNGTTLSAADATSNRYDGTINGATATVDVVNGGAGFSGSSAYIQSTSTLNKTSIGTTPTLSFWMKATGAQSTKGILQIADALTSGNPWILLQRSDSANIKWYLNGDYRITQSASDNTAYHIALTYDGTTWRAYKNGVGDGSFTDVVGSKSGNYVWLGNGWQGDYSGSLDEWRVANVARSTNWIYAEYLNMASNTAFNTYGAVETVGGGGGTSPTITNAAVTSVTSAGATFNGTLTTTGTSACAVGVLWGTDTNSWATLNWFNDGAVNSGWTNSTPFSTNVTLSPNLNYYYTYVASNASGMATASPPVALITGNVTVEATDNSATYLSDNGTFTISRPPDLTNAALVVNYTTNGSTAVAGTDYTALSGSVTLNPGVSNATVTVTPLRYPLTPCTVLLTLAAGGYATGTFNTATVTVQPKPPTAYTSTQNGNWHDPATWGSSTYPNGLGDSVTISAGHTVTVAQVTTAYTVSNLTVNGNLTHLANTGSTEQYKINITVMGDLNVAGAIDANGKGWATSSNPGPGAGSGVLWAGSHGGMGWSIRGPTYGSITNPVALGSAGWHGAIRAGGGAILLRVSGASTISGVISANGQVFTSAGHGGGSGGSVNLVTGTLTGGGTISANSTPLPWEGYGGGGGRVAVILTATGAGFGDFTGSMSAVSAANRSGERGAAGTIYRKTQAQDYGDLIVNDVTRTSSSETIISTNVTDWKVGNVTLTSTAMFRVATNAQIAICGSLTNDSTSTFTADGLSTVSFVGTTTGTVYGSRTFWNLFIGDAGKKPLKFEAGKTISVTKDLSMSNAWLRSSVDGSAWKLTVNPSSGTQTSIRDVDARNSDASAGSTIEALNSTDSGMNTNWSFFSTMGETNTWTGGADSSWINTNNWDLRRLPVSYDVIRISSAGTSPKLNVAKVLYALIVDNGATLDLNGKDLTVQTNALISGTLKATASETITFQRDVDFTLGGLTPASSTVVLAGTVPQTVTLDGTETFATLKVQGTNATFNGGFAATRFMCSTPGAALTFKAGSLYTIGRLDLIGTTANKLVLRSTDSGTSWQLKVTNLAYVVAVDVARSDANVSGGLTIKPVASVDSLNNANWDFGGSWRVWTGGTSTNFTDTANWNPSGGTLDSSSRLYVQTNGVNGAVLSGTLTVADLVVGGGGSATVTLNAPLTVTNDLRVLTNGVLTHTANAGSTEQYKLNVTVSGSLYVDGMIDANAKGWASSANYGPGAVGSGALWPASHGGTCRNDGGNGSINNTYGSVTNPVALGSAGYHNSSTPNLKAGGGAILLRVSGASAISGTIRANGQDAAGAFGGGSGGSVNLVSGTITGNGVVQANASFGIDGHGGGGGRIAVVLTSPGADFSGFTGSMETYSYAARGSGGERGAPGTIYCKAQAQEYGDLLVRDNGVNYSSHKTVIGTNVTDTTVGNVMVTSYGNLLVATNTQLAIGGILTNDSTATFTADGLSTVAFVGPTTGTVYGSRSFYNLTIGDPGVKPLYFQAGRTQLVAKALSINNAYLRSTQDGTSWGLKLDTVSGTQPTIQYVNVRNSDASPGATISARDSTNAGGNVNWTFFTPGQTNVWLGTVNSDWQNSNNWSLARLPASEDVIRIASGGTTPKLNPSSTLLALLIDSGAELDLNGKDLTVTTNAVISGTLKATASETVTFQRDVDFTLGGMTPAGSTVVLAGTVPQTVTLDGTETFATLRVQATNATFNGGFTATRFWCPTPGAALTFKAGSLYTINRLDLIGTVANRLVLRSTDSGTSWRLKVTGYAHAVAVDVARSDANVSGGITIKPVASVDSLNNDNWDFGGSWRVWTGGTSTNFADTANWNPSGGTIDSSSRLYVQSTNGVNAPVLSGTLTVADLVVGGGGSALLTLNAALTVTNDLRVLTNGVLTHSVNAGATEQFKLNVTVGGSLYVDGAIDANAKGWASSANYGPGAGASDPYGACHGGAARSLGYADSVNKTYGSVTNPVALGSAGSHLGSIRAGGGAILLEVTGATWMNGVVRANGQVFGGGMYGGGSGGSVNLRTGTIAGYGVIQANSSTGMDGHGGGGGRVAVILRSPGADFSGFTGSMEAYSYADRGSGTERGAPGTIYRKAQAQEYGDLIIKDNGVYYSSFTTYISTNVTDTTVGNVIIMTNGNLVVGSNTHLRIGGSLTNDSTSTFTTETNSTVSFIGTTTGTVYGSRSFYNLSIGGSVTKPLNFEAGKTMAVAKDLSINRAVLRSTSPGSAWFLTLANVGGTQSSITRVDVQDSNATNGQTIVALRYSIDSGRNLNWQFISPEGAVFIFR